MMNKLRAELKYKWVEKNVPVKERDKILDFYSNFDGYRTPYMCSQVTGIDLIKCSRTEEWLRYTRKIGAYVFEADAPPQSYMVKWISERYPMINNESKILEVGPGNNPLFSEKVYKNWVGIDKGYVETEYGGKINFHNFEWGKGMYSNIYAGGWENLSEVCKNNEVSMGFDLVCGSHSFEHTGRPVRALKEASRVLKKDGILVLFVPDGYSQDPGNKDCTHTMYLIPEMVDDLFEAADCFDDVKVEQFRTNLDIVITAKAKR